MAVRTQVDARDRDTDASCGRSICRRHERHLAVIALRPQLDVRPVARVCASDRRRARRELVCPRRLPLPSHRVEARAGG